MRRSMRESVWSVKWVTSSVGGWDENDEDLCVMAKIFSASELKPKWLHLKVWRGTGSDQFKETSETQGIVMGIGLNWVE